MRTDTAIGILHHIGPKSNTDTLHGFKIYEFQMPSPEMLVVNMCVDPKESFQYCLGNLDEVLGEEHS